MGTVVGIILDVLSIIAIIGFGAFLVVVVADLILSLFDDHKGIFFKRNKEEEVKKVESKAEVQKSDDIIVYKDKMIGESLKTESTKVNNDVNMQSVDFDKAAEEQAELNAKRGIQSQSSETKPTVATAPQKKIVEPRPAPKKNDIFDDISVDDDFNDFLDEIIEEAKKGDKPQKVEKPQPVKKDVDDETKKEIEELKKLKEEHQKELEEFKKLKEDFAREKEEQLALMKENLDKAKAEEIERLKAEALKEQENLEKEKARLEEEQQKLEEQQSKLAEEQKATQDKVTEETTIVKETIIKDEEEINKLKYKNLMRMNARLTRIIKDTEKLQTEKEKKQAKMEEERQRMLAIEAEKKAREQERLVAIQNRNREMLAKQQQALKKQEINQKLENAKKSASKYQLNSKVVKLSKNTPEIETKVIEEVVTTVEETIPGTDTVITTVDKTPLVASPKPVFEKEYYEKKLEELDAELKDAEKELRQNKAEYIPLTRIYKAYDRDSEKLRKKEMQVAKQKIAMYGVNSNKADPAKKAKLDENLQALAELKDSVDHCEEVIRKNKDRYPVLEKNNKLILKQIDRINEDIRTCEKAISYYNKKK